MTIFDTYINKCLDNQVALQDVRIWQNGRTIYNRCFELDVKRVPKETQSDIEFILSGGYQSNSELSCNEIRDLGLIKMERMKGDNVSCAYVYDSDNGQTCLVMPEINTVIAITAITADDSRIAIDLAKTIIIPDLTEHPRDNSMLNGLDELFREYFDEERKN